MKFVRLIVLALAGVFLVPNLASAQDFGDYAAYTDITLTNTTGKWKTGCGTLPNSYGVRAAEVTGFQYWGLDTPGTPTAMYLLNTDAVASKTAAIPPYAVHTIAAASTATENTIATSQPVLYAPLNVNAGVYKICVGANADSASTVGYLGSFTIRVWYRPKGFRSDLLNPWDALERLARVLMFSDEEWTKLTGTRGA